MPIQRGHCLSPYLLLDMVLLCQKVSVRAIPWNGYTKKEFRPARSLRVTPGASTHYRLPSFCLAEPKCYCTDRDTSCSGITIPTITNHWYTIGGPGGTQCSRLSPKGRISNSLHDGRSKH